VSDIVLDARNLVKRFGRVAAVNDVSFSVRQGEVLTLLGPSGCGKTTTLRIVAGFERPDAGELEIQGQVVVSTRRRIHVPPERCQLGMVFQSYAIWPHMTVFENVAYPLQVRRQRGEAVRRQVMDTLELVGLGDLASRPALLLSGGQQQRVALARALVYSPSILLLDEPLSNLDAKLRRQMRIELKALQERLGVTMLFVTHDQIEAMSLTTSLAVMNEGRIEQVGTPQEVYEHPQTPYVEDFLGSVIRVHGTVVERTPAGLVVALNAASTPLHVEPAEQDLAPGQAVVIAIRPEDVELRAPDDRRADNVLRCAVEKVLYLGSECELLFRFGEQSHTLPVPRALATRLTDQVSLHLPADALRVWPTDAASAGTPTPEAPPDGQPSAPTLPSSASSAQPHG
jgi:ABC-type Fe3+/spermidine/putrescine transport system ATPase subunit